MDNTDAARRGVPKCDGIYIEGSVEGVNLYYAVDTGASTTILSASVYNRIPKGKRPNLNPTRPLNVADGRPLGILGRGEFDMRIGPLRIKSEMTVANISDDALLGADVIQNGSKGPADLLLSEQRMVLNGASIPLMLFGIPDKTRKAYAADHYIVPPMCEMVLDVYVDRGENEQGDKNIMIEPAPQIGESIRLVMASCLVNVADNTTVKVRVLNPTKDPVSIKQDAVLGHAHAVHQTPQCLMLAESGDSDDFTSIRRVDLGGTAPITTPNNIREVQESKSGEPLTVPEHLRELYDSTVIDKSFLEAQSVAGLWLGGGIQGCVLRQ